MPSRPVRLTFPAREPGARRIMADGVQAGHCLATPSDHWVAYFWAVRSDPHMGVVREEKFPDLAELRAEVRGQLEDHGPWWSETAATREAG